MKYLFTLSIFLFAIGAFARQKPSQYVMIIRSKADVKAPAEKIKINIQHWTIWMNDLGKNGKIVAGYRFPTDGITLTQANKPAKPNAYITDGNIVSSFLIINAANLNEAKKIAATCPVFELGGNVEIRDIQNTAN